MDAIAPIIEQHAVDAAFLWTTRTEALRSPTTRVEDIARFDDRLEANLDGLRFAGDVGAEAVFSELPHGDAGAVFAATVVAIESARTELLGRLLEEAPAADLWRGLAGASAWLPFEPVSAALEGLGAAHRDAARRAALVACTAHGRHPGAALHTALLDDDPELVATALRAIGVLRVDELRPVLTAAMLASDRQCRFWAAWAGVLLGERSACAVLRAMAEHGRSRGDRNGTRGRPGMDCDLGGPRGPASRRHSGRRGPRRSSPRPDAPRLVGRPLGGGPGGRSGDGHHWHCRNRRALGATDPRCLVARRANVRLGRTLDPRAPARARLAASSLARRAAARARSGRLRAGAVG